MAVSNDKVKLDEILNLLPLQLFNLRKELEYFRRRNNIEKIKKLSIKAKEIASIIADKTFELLFVK
ncbi:hypothetical protein FC789_10205 [Clostridium botulinum]|nr:hypothetical protein [Clostridium botulinum]